MIPSTTKMKSESPKRDVDFWTSFKSHLEHFSRRPFSLGDDFDFILDVPTSKKKVTDSPLGMAPLNNVIHHNSLLNRLISFIIYNSKFPPYKQRLNYCCLRNKKYTISSHASYLKFETRIDFALDRWCIVLRVLKWKFKTERPPVR